MSRLLMFSTAFILAAAVAAAIVSLVLKVGSTRGLLDHPNARSSHDVPTPRGGGIGIVAVVLGGIALLAVMDRGAPSLAPLALGMLCIALTGFIDDLRGLGAVPRLLVHTAVATWTVISYGSIRDVLVPGLPVVHLGVLGPALTVAWIVGLTNAYNFMDGIDGIAASQAVVAASAWALFLLARGETQPALLVTLVAGASAGFLLFNWSPASVFMGDVGSGALGYLFATIPVLYLSMDSNQTPGVAWFFGAAVMAPFVFDTMYTFTARAMRRENLLQAHRSHLYQRLVKTGFSHARVASGYIGLAIYTSATAIAAAESPGWMTTLAVALPLLFLVATVHAVEGASGGWHVRGDL